MHSNGPTRPSICLDWLTVSWPDCPDTFHRIDWIREHLGPSTLTPSRVADYAGWDIAGGFGFVGWRMRKTGERDVLLRLPGQALEWWRNSGDQDVDLVRDLLAEGGRVTRIDVAIDVADPDVSPATVWDAWNAGTVTSRALNCSVVMPGKAPPEIRASDEYSEPRQGAGWTVYIGSRSSSRFMRCYDKRAEFLKKAGKDVGHELTRFEWETKGEAAMKLAMLIADEDIDAAVEVFRGWIAFRERGDNRQRTRWDYADWWRRIVGEGEIRSLGLYREVATPERTARWLMEDVATSIYYASQFSPEVLERAKVIGRRRRNAQKMKQWRAAFGEDLTWSELIDDHLAQIETAGATGPP